MTAIEDVEAYAAVAAELAHAGDKRAAVLARLDLTEDAWDKIDAHWQRALSDAEAAVDEGIPKLLTTYTKAFARASATLGSQEVLAFETFCGILRTLEEGGDARGLFERFGTTLPAFLSAQAHWVKRMTADPVLLARFSQRRSLPSRK